MKVALRAAPAISSERGVDFNEGLFYHRGTQKVHWRRTNSALSLQVKCYNHWHTLLVSFIAL